MPDQYINPPAAGSVRLRAVSEDDLMVFYEQQLDPAATRMAAFPAREREAHLAHWHKILAQPGVITRTILFDEQVAGNIVSWEQAGKRKLGYWIGQPYWGQGIATRALSYSWRRSARVRSTPTSLNTTWPPNACCKNAALSPRPKTAAPSAASPAASR